MLFKSVTSPQEDKASSHSEYHSLDDVQGSQWRSETDIYPESLQSNGCSDELVNVHSDEDRDSDVETPVDCEPAMCYDFSDITQYTNAKTTDPGEAGYSQGGVIQTVYNDPHSEHNPGSPLLREPPSPEPSPSPEPGPSP